jgi:hypothetical protein
MNAFIVSNKSNRAKEKKKREKKNANKKRDSNRTYLHLYRRSFLSPEKKMSQEYQRQTNGARNLSQFLASEARLTRLHRLFKTHFNVTEPSIILEPYLFLGNCISAHDTNHLSALGIRYILNVAIRDVELCPYYSNDMRTLTIDLRDDDRENILRTFDQAFAFIDEAKQNQSRVLVHCSHGQR